MASLVRSAVAARTRLQRFQERGYDLDLSYICPNVIAMGLPSSGMEATYRNDIDTVSRMLNEFHERYYMIWNLSQCTYDYSKFDNRVLDFGWPDHHSPPLDLTFQVCQSMATWLRDPKNVACVHCKAGKGRTGTIISCFLLYTEACATAEEAMAYFAQRRSVDGDLGVDHPSQRRYVHYFERILKGFEPDWRPRRLNRVIMKGVPNFDGKGGCKAYVKVYEQIKGKHHVKYTSKDAMKLLGGDDAGTAIRTDVVISGDILFRFKHRGLAITTRMFRFGFNTGFLSHTNVLRLFKQDLDEGCRDKRIPDGFFIDVVFDPISPEDAKGHTPVAAMPWDQILRNRTRTMPRVVKFPPSGPSPPSSPVLVEMEPVVDPPSLPPSAPPIAAPSADRKSVV